MSEGAAVSDAEVWVVLQYDPNGTVWLVARSNLPGLYLQDKTLEGLIGRVRELAPSLMIDNLGEETGSMRLRIDIPDSLAAVQSS